MASALKGLDIAATTGVVVTAVATIITTMLAQKMKDDISVYKGDDSTEQDNNEKIANRESKAMTWIYVFALLFLIVYVGYIGYEQGHRQCGSGSSISTSLRDYGISMYVLAYVLMAVLITTGSVGIDLYKRGSKFGDVDDYPDGAKYSQAKSLYAVYITMIVISVVAISLLTAYLVDAKKYIAKAYNYSFGTSSNLPSSYTASRYPSSNVAPGSSLL